MIRILHTADLHIGKVIYEHSLIEDQKKVLDQLQTLLIEEKAKNAEFSALIISGDIYDRSIPNPDAIKLFDSFLTEVKKENPDLLICLHPGNHDSAARLSYASSLLENQHIYIATNLRDTLKPLIISKKNTRGEERLALFQIPFLTIGFLHGEEGAENLKSQSEMLSFVIDKIKNQIAIMEKEIGAKIHAILSAHVFTLGGNQSDSERSILGTAEFIDADIFSPFTYTALGHLHKCQKVFEKENAIAYYSGSPLAYSFGEGEKFFLDITFDWDIEKDKEISDSEKLNTIDIPKLDARDNKLDENELFEMQKPKVVIQKIPVKPLRKMVQVAGRFSEFFSETNFDLHKEDYLEITLKDASLIENPMQLLKGKFPHLLSINQKYALSKREGGSLLGERKEMLEKQNSFESILKSFLEDVASSLEDDSINELMESAKSIRKEMEAEETR